MTSSFSELLAQRQFMRFWLARIFGVSAHQMLMLAISWHMYELTGSAWDLGLVGLFQFIPALVMALPAGHVIDRLHRGRIFATCMLVLALVAVVLCVATWQAQASRELIFVVAWVLGVTRAFQMPAQQAITPLLVPKHLFQRAIALSSTGVEVSVIGGPAIGGVLYLSGALTVYSVCAVLFTFSMLLTLWVRYEHVVRHNSLSWQSLFAGVAFVWERKVLLGAISLDLFAVLLGGATALLPIFARDILHVGRTVWGCCEQHLPPGPCACPSSSPAGRFNGRLATSCWPRWRSSVWLHLCSAYQTVLCCRWRRWPSQARQTTSAWSRV
jgi:MFS family permease